MAESGTPPMAGKTVLVTGGTGGLGREVTMAFLEAGATVEVTYVVSDEYAALASAAAVLVILLPVSVTRRELRNPVLTGGAVQNWK